MTFQYHKKPLSELTPEERDSETAELEDDWTADLLTIAAGEEAMAQQRESNTPSPAIPESLAKALEHL